MAPFDPKAVICEECLAILRELRLAVGADADTLRTRFEETAASAGQDANAFAERWVRSVKQECLSKLILFGEGSLKRALTEFTAHYHSERPHQGKGNTLLFPSQNQAHPEGSHLVCKERLGGILKYYYRAA